MKVFLVSASQTSKSIAKGSDSYVYRKVDIWRNKIFHLEDSMIMYGIYNSDTLEQSIETVHRMHNTTCWHEKIFAGKVHHWFEWYLHKDRSWPLCNKFHIFLTTIREK